MKNATANVRLVLVNQVFAQVVLKVDTYKNHQDLVLLIAIITIDGCQ